MNWLTTSAEAMLAASASRRFFCQRASTAGRIPSACTASACWRTVSAKASDDIEAVAASSIERRDSIWLSSDTTTRSTRPPSANQPSQGWNMKIAAMKIGVQGMSKIAKSTGEDMKRCTDSRSRRPDQGRPRSPDISARVSPESKTFASRRVWNSAPIRAATRPRA